MESPGPGPLNTALHHALLSLHQHPYPHVSNPPNCKKRGAVSLILRVRPDYLNWPGSPVLIPDRSISVDQQLNLFFSQDWVQYGDPEVLFIKRASRVGDRWTGHVALPGGMKDPDDRDDQAAAIREAEEEIGLDLVAKECIFVSNLPERLVTASWGSVPLLILCPFIFLWTSNYTPSLKLQPTEVASIHWVSLRALLSPSLRTVEYVNTSERYAKRGGFVARLTNRFMTGMMEFSAIKLVPTESLYCSLIPGFLPGDKSLSIFQRLKARCLSEQASSSDKSRPLLLWGLTLGILADFLEMLPPHNMVELWTYPTFTSPDLRLIVKMLTYGLRKRNILKVKAADFENETSTESQAAETPFTEIDSNHDLNRVEISGMGVGRYYGPPSTDMDNSTRHAVGIMLTGYYDRLWLSVYVCLAWRVTLGAITTLYAWRWLRRR